MSMDATPQASNTPPRIRLDFDSDDPAAVFTSLDVTRDGVVLREIPILGSTESFVFDYEAPFGTAVTYEANGTITTPAPPEWTESWASLAAWSGSTSSFSVGGGAASSAVLNAAITRTASGAIGSLTVDDPRFVSIDLLDSSDDEVVSVEFGDNTVALSGFGTDSAAGGGSFTLTLAGETATAAGVGGWTLGVEYSGVPVKVRVTSKGTAYPFDSEFGVPTQPYGVTTMSGGDILVNSTGEKKIRRYTPAGVEVTTGSFPVSTVGLARGICVDGSDNIYTCDADNRTIRKFNSTGASVTSWTTGGDYPYGIAFNTATSNLHVSVDNDSAGHAGAIRRYTTAGVAVGSPWSTGANSIPRDVAVLAGNSYVTDGRNDQIKKYDSSGALLLTIAAGTDLRGIAVNSSGIFVACPEERSVRKYSHAGAFLQTVISGRFYDITFDGSGNLLGTATDEPTFPVKTYTATNASVGEITESPQGPSDTFFATATTSLDVTEAWLMHPSQPELSVSIDPGPNAWRGDGLNVDITSAQQTARPGTSTVHNPVGRSRPIVITSGARQVGSWTLVLVAPRIVDRDAVNSILDDQSPLLLRSPASFGWDLPDDWYAVGDVTIDRIFQPLQYEDRRITLPLTPVDAPIVSRSEGITYADVLVSFGTYQAVLDNGTYLKLLAGA